MEQCNNEFNKINASNASKSKCACSANNIEDQQGSKITHAYSYYTIHSFPKSWKYKSQSATIDNCENISLANTNNAKLTKRNDNIRETCIGTGVDETKCDEHTEENAEESVCKVLSSEEHKIERSSDSIPSISFSLTSVNDRSLCLLPSLPKQEPKSAGLHNSYCCKWNCANDRNKYKPMGSINRHDINESCKKNCGNVITSNEQSSCNISKAQYNSIAKEDEHSDGEDEIFCPWFAIMQSSHKNNISTTNNKRMFNIQENDVTSIELEQEPKNHKLNDNIVRSQVNEIQSRETKHQNMEDIGAEHSLCDAGTDHVNNSHKKLSTLTEVECGLSHSEELLFIDYVDEPLSPIIHPGAEEKISRDGAHRQHFNTINVTEAFKIT